MDLSKINKEFFRIGDRSKEEFIYVFNKSESLPLNIDCAGITNPMPGYFIRRKGALFFVFEQILEGEGTLVYNGAEHKLETGDFYCLEPGSEQYYYSSAENPMKKIWINFYCGFFPKIFEETGLTGTGVFHGFNAADKMTQLYSLIQKTPDNEAIAYPVMNILFSIVSDLSRFVSEKKDREKISETAKMTKFLLNESLTKKINVEDISAKLYKSKSQINRDFVRYYGTTPYKYLLDRRLELAKFMLANTNSTVKEISDTLVFVDEHYFCTLFKEKCGMTPGQYRQKTNGK